MNWYIKLFLPAIAGFVLWLTLWLLNESGIYRVQDELAITWIFCIVSWGAVQTLFFPKREHKSRYRGWLIACILVFVFAAFSLSVWNLSFSKEARAFFVLFISSAAAAVLYFFRHRKSEFSLVPKIAELKKLCTLAALSGHALLWFFVFDLEETRFLRGVVSNSTAQQAALILGILFLVALVAAAVLYYLEAIMYRLRNSAKSWDKRLGEIGDNDE